MAQIPPGGQVPVEPIKLPCGNVEECKAVKAMIAANRWSEWGYEGTKYCSTGTATCASYTHEHLLAWIHQVPGAWPPPPPYPYNDGQKPANAVLIISRPPPAD